VQDVFDIKFIHAKIDRYQIMSQSFIPIISTWAVPRHGYLRIMGGPRNGKSNLAKDRKGASSAV
jgi:hypothetical protein